VVKECTNEKKTVINFVQITRNQIYNPRVKRRQKETNEMCRKSKDSLSDTHTHALKHGTKKKNEKQNLRRKT
jgi:hypothetical protein